MKRLNCALTVGLVTAVLQSASAQTFHPLITKSIGSGSLTSYLVLDFKDATSTPSFAFQYSYDGAQTAGDIIDALASDGDVTFTSTDYGTPPTRNRFVDSLTIGTHNQSDSVDRLGYWSVWYSGDGQAWNYSTTEGTDGLTLTNGSWEGLSWDADYTNDSALTAPVTPAAAPEPSSLWVMASGVVCLGITAVRRRQRQRPA